MYAKVCWLNTLTIHSVIRYQKKIFVPQFTFYIARSGRKQANQYFNNINFVLLQFFCRTLIEELLLVLLLFTITPLYILRTLKSLKTKTIIYGKNNFTLRRRK